MAEPATIDINGPFEFKRKDGVVYIVLTETMGGKTVEREIQLEKDTTLKINKLQTIPEGRERRPIYFPPGLNLKLENHTKETLPIESGQGLESQYEVVFEKGNFKTSMPPLKAAQVGFAKDKQVNTIVPENYMIGEDSAQQHAILRFKDSKKTITVGKEAALVIEPRLQPAPKGADPVEVPSLVIVGKELQEGNNKNYKLYQNKVIEVVDKAMQLPQKPMQPDLSKFKTAQDKLAAQQRYQEQLTIYNAKGKAQGAMRTQLGLGTPSTAGYLPKPHNDEELKNATLFPMPQSAPKVVDPKTVDPKIDPKLPPKIDPKMPKAKDTPLTAMLDKKFAVIDRKNTNVEVDLETLRNMINAKEGSVQIQVDTRRNAVVAGLGELIDLKKNPNLPNAEKLKKLTNAAKQFQVVNDEKGNPTVGKIVGELLQDIEKAKNSKLGALDVPNLDQVIADARDWMKTPLKSEGSVLVASAGKDAGMTRA